jgi:putative membrane-bound dehydrogenase-like protein
MKRLALLTALLFAASSWVVVTGQPAAPVQTVALGGQTFTLPPGFTIELVAAPPLVNRPIEADFDEQGRLYVTDSSGSNDALPIQLQKKPHRVVRLEDTHGDGRFDRATAFADHMMFPEGCAWIDGSLYVSGVPSIWKLTDADGDGVAERRSEWFQGKTMTGCGNDLHGPYAGPDGWVYWCKGAFDRQTYPRPGKSPFVTRASHIFRSRPDGSGIEPVMTGGMDNPVELVFTPGGERIITTTFFQHPGGGRRDGLIHTIYGGIYGKDHDPIYDPAHKWTGPALMPVLTHLGPAAPCGLVRYESGAFGREYRDNLFATLFNLHKVTRHILQADGATFTTRDEDFLVSSNPDFHPTDVLEDADGSLLVLDTGGWYKLCCPTSQLHKPDVLGAIYRIRRNGMFQIEDPRGLKLAWDRMTAAELTRLLDDPRPAVRRRAVAALGSRGATSLPSLREVLQQFPTVEARRNAVWAASRIHEEEARRLVRTALHDADESVRQVAGHSASLWRDRGALDDLRHLLRNESLQNRRVAAEALGRLGDPAAVPALLAALGERTDRVLDHSLTYALIEIDDPGRTRAGLSSPNPAVRRAALAALDQMDGGGLGVKQVAAELSSPNTALRETAAWIVRRHPEWGGDLAGYFRERLAAKHLSPDEQAELAGQLAGLARNEAVQRLLAVCVENAERSPAAARVVLRAMARSGLKAAPERWLAAFRVVLGSQDADLVREAVATARALPTATSHDTTYAAGLTRIGTDPKRLEEVRLAALAAVPLGLLEPDDALFDFLVSRLDREQPVAVRGAAAEALSRAKLSGDRMVKLAQALPTAGPMEVTRLLDVYTRSTEDRVGRALLAALNEPSVRAGLHVEVVKPHLEKYGPEVKKEAEKLYAALNAGKAKQSARLEQLLAGLKGGDVRRGQTVFNGAKTACSSCHTIGYLGGNIGPDLTHIGSIRTERDLLESIVFPSASFVRSYEPMLVTTTDGKIYNGVVRKDAPDELVLATGANQEVRLPRDTIEDVQPSKVSVMPAGFDQQLTPQQLADLVTFLKGCR